jgi:hypothetical protein
MVMPTPGPAHGYALPRHVPHARNMMSIGNDPGTEHYFTQLQIRPLDEKKGLNQRINAISIDQCYYEIQTNMLVVYLTPLEDAQAGSIYTVYSDKMQLKSRPPQVQLTLEREINHYAYPCNIVKIPLDDDCFEGLVILNLNFLNSNLQSQTIQVRNFG